MRLRPLGLSTKANVRVQSASLVASRFSHRRTWGRPAMPDWWSRTTRSGRRRCGVCEIMEQSRSTFTGLSAVISGWIHCRRLWCWRSCLSWMAGRRPEKTMRGDTISFLPSPAYAWRTLPRLPANDGKLGRRCLCRDGARTGISTTSM